MEFKTSLTALSKVKFFLHKYCFSTLMTENFITGQFFFFFFFVRGALGQVVQSIVSLRSSLVVKKLTVLVNTISN